MVEVTLALYGYSALEVRSGLDRVAAVWLAASERRWAWSAVNYLPICVEEMGNDATLI